VIRARNLFPLRNGSVTVAAKPTAERIRQHRTSVGCASDKHPMPQARRQRPGFRIFAQPSVDQRVYAAARPQRFCRLRMETAGTREKSKSLPHNMFTHVNAPAASGIPAAPYLGMTCRPLPHAKHGRFLTFTVSTRRITPHHGPPLDLQPPPLRRTPLRFRASNRWFHSHCKVRPIGGLIRTGNTGNSG